VTKPPGCPLFQAGHPRQPGGYLLRTPGRALTWNHDMTTDTTTTPTAFLRHIFGNRDGTITYVAGDGSEPRPALLSEFVPPDDDGEVWISTAIDGQRFAVVAEVPKGSVPHPAPSLRLTNADATYDFAIWCLSGPADDRLNVMLRAASGMEDADIESACPLAGHGGWK
jgi:hypothetical protein